MFYLSPQSSSLFNLPPELCALTMSFLRASDCASLQQTCLFFDDQQLINRTVNVVATEVYPKVLTLGYETARVSGTNFHPPTAPHNKLPSPTHPDTKLKYHHMRNMEMLVVARVLSSPEPTPQSINSDEFFYISKAWCKSALKWLDSTANETLPKKHLSSRKKKVRERKFSDVSPPWQSINEDITCEHGALKGDSRGKRKIRRVVDRQAMRVLKQLYPQSLSFSTHKSTECSQCMLKIASAQNCKDEQLKLAIKLANERRSLVMDDDDLRSLFTRTKGVSSSAMLEHAVATTETETLAQSLNDFSPFSSPVKTKINIIKTCPLIPGTYAILPRIYLRAWRKFLKESCSIFSVQPPEIKSLEDMKLVCYAHQRGLIPPHLDSFLTGECKVLFGGNNYDLDGENAIVVEILTETEFAKFVEIANLGNVANGGVLKFEVKKIDNIGEIGVEWKNRECFLCDKLGRSSSSVKKLRQRSSSMTDKSEPKWFKPLFDDVE